MINEIEAYLLFNTGLSLEQIDDIELSKAFSLIKEHKKQKAEEIKEIINVINANYATINSQSTAVAISAAISGKEQEITKYINKVLKSLGFENSEPMNETGFDIDELFDDIGVYCGQ